MAENPCARVKERSPHARGSLGWPVRPGRCHPDRRPSRDHPDALQRLRVVGDQWKVVGKDVVARLEAGKRSVWHLPMLVPRPIEQRVGFRRGKGGNFGMVLKGQICTPACNIESVANGACVAAI